VDQALAMLPAGAEGHVLDLADAKSVQDLFALMRQSYGTGQVLVVDGGALLV
jgi:hypothetical protein